MVLQQSGFAFKSRQPVSIPGELLRQRLDRDFAAESGIARLPYLSHAAFADGRKDFVVAECRARLHEFDEYYEGRAARVNRTYGLNATACLRLFRNRVIALRASNLE